MGVKERIDSLLQEDIRLGREIDKTVRRMNAEVKVLRLDIKEKTSTFEGEIETLKIRKDQIRKDILSLWKQNFDTRITVRFPSAMVSRKNFRELIIHDKIALVNALDRIDRLDLVDYVFKESEVARLCAGGKLEGLTPESVELNDKHKLQVRPAKGNKHG